MKNYDSTSYSKIIFYPIIKIVYIRHLLDSTKREFSNSTNRELLPLYFKVFFFQSTADSTNREFAICRILQNATYSIYVVLYYFFCLLKRKREREKI